MSVAHDAIATAYAETAAVYGVHVEEMSGKGRRRQVSLARQAAWFAIRNCDAVPTSARTFPSIAEASGRDHATVMHGCRSAADRLEVGDRDMRQAVRAATDALRTSIAGAREAPLRDCLTWLANMHAVVAASLGRVPAALATPRASGCACDCCRTWSPGQAVQMPSDAEISARLKFVASEVKAWKQKNARLDTIAKPGRGANTNQQGGR